MATADARIRSTDDVAVVFDKSTSYTDLFWDDLAVFRFAGVAGAG